MNTDLIINEFYLYFIINVIFSLFFYFLKGCPGTKLWKNLEETSPPFPMKIDDDVKTYLWKGIVEVLDLKFYALEKPLPHIFANCEEENRKKFNWNIKVN